MLPRIEERLRIKRTDVAPHFVQFEHARTFGNEQTNAELDGGDIFDQGFITNHAQQIEVTFQRGPLREWHERGMKGHAECAESVNDMQEIFARVAFIEGAEHGVIQVFHGADDEEAAGFALVLASAASYFFRCSIFMVTS